MDWIQTAPLWVVGVAFVLLLLGAQQLGFAARRARLSRTPDPPADGVGYIIPAALTLLSLLIAFTFAAANERYSTRRRLVVEEANAIMTAYLRVQVLDASARQPITEAMLGYLDTRQTFDLAGDDSQRVSAADLQSEQRQGEVWRYVVHAVRTDPSPVHNGLVGAVNAMFDTAAERRAAQDARVPTPVLRSLVIFSVVVAAMLGYALGAGTRHLAASATLFALLAIALTLILDLDRSGSGRVKVSQAPMERTLAAIRRMEAARPAVPVRAAANR